MVRALGVAGCQVVKGDERWWERGRMVRETVHDNIVVSYGNVRSQQTAEWVLAALEMWPGARSKVLAGRIPLSWSCVQRHLRTLIALGLVERRVHRLQGTAHTWRYFLRESRVPSPQA